MIKSVGMVVKMKKIFIFCCLLNFVFSSSYAQDVSEIVSQTMNEDLFDNEQSEKEIAENNTGFDTSVVEDFNEEQAENNTEVIETPQAVDSNISLTENLTNNKQDNKTIEDNDASTNWIDKLIENSTQNSSDSKKDDSLSNIIDDNKTPTKQRSNASVFDISGVMLRMTLAQAEDALLKRGYKKISQKLEIPNFIKWRNEEICRGSGVVGYERLENCVAQKAKKENYQYVESSQYAKYDTKESISLHLTSTFTNNKIYKILYKSESALIRGSSQKASYLRNIKVFDFWKKINQKYGHPDNPEEVLWGLGGNKPYMKASTGILLLEDPMLRELDFTRMSREDQRFMNTNLYNF